MSVNVRSEQVASAIALGEFATLFWADGVGAFDLARIGCERRVAKLMAAKAQSGRTENRRSDGLDFHVTDRLQPIVHERIGVDQTGHRIRRTVEGADRA